MAGKEDFLVDCIITAGESDPDHYGKWLDNDLRHYEVAKHNVPYSKFQEWMLSNERWNRVRDLEKIGKDRFGEDYWMKYKVCCFCTSSNKD
jgi:hypothetical protein